MEKWRNWKRIRQTDKKGQSCRDNAKTRLPLQVRLLSSPQVVVLFYYNKNLIIADIYELGEENLKYGMYIFIEIKVLI